MCFSSLYGGHICKNYWICFDEELELLLLLTSEPYLLKFGRDRYCAVAENVADAERASLWHQIVELNPHQEGYLEKALRKIPLVWLRRSQ